MPAPLPEHITHSIELLSSLGPVRVRRMFGGFGFYVDEVFMAIGIGDELYLKTDDITRSRFDAAGCRPFVYEGSSKAVTVSYWTVPAEALESPALMLPWARLAFEAGLRARTAKAPKRAVNRPRRTR